jgi:hypothetical protein
MPKPVEIELNDQLARFNTHADRLIKIIERYQIAQQINEATKVPTRQRFYTVNVDAITAPPTVVQVLRRDPLRKEVSFINDGPSTCLINNQWFDPTSIQQQFSDPTNPSTVPPVANQIIQIGYLAVGGTLTFQGQEGIWVFNNSPSSGALLSIIETIYSSPAKDATPTPGLDGALMGGYTVVNDGESQRLVKGLR